MHYQVHYCETKSSAEYLILSSGLGGHAAFWQPQIDVLKQHFHVLTYDQEGCHADTAFLAKNYSMTNMAQQVLNLLQQQNIQNFHFIGHALGGHIGLELARLLDTSLIQCKSLTCINAWNNLDPHTQKCFQARVSLLKNSGNEAYVRAQALFLYPPQWISEHHKDLHDAENRQLEDFPPQKNVLARLKALQQFSVNEQHVEALKNTRLHYIANQDDFLVPVKKSTELQQQIGHGTLSIFPTGAHASTITETAQLNHAILNFLLN